MTRQLLTATLAAILTAGLFASHAEARDDHGHYNSHHGHHNDWEARADNRRDARRAAVVTGVVAAGVTNAAAQNRAERRYEQCVYATGYDYDCERRLYYEEQQARDRGRRAGVVAGAVAYGVVRD